MSVDLTTIAAIKREADYSGVAPTLDVSDGVLVGDQAIDSVTKQIWMCLDNTEGSPVWVEVFRNPVFNNVQFIDLTTDLSAVGFIKPVTVGEPVAFEDLLYLKSDGKWWKADADATSTMPGLCLALASKLADETCNILCYGHIKNNTRNRTVGGLVYADTEPGAMTQVAPSGSGDQVQVVGIAVSATVLFFNPSLVLTEIL